MEEELKHIDPSKLTDLRTMRKLLYACMNMIETQSKIIEEQGKKLQSLEDEVNRLKGEHGSYVSKQKQYKSNEQQRNKKKSSSSKNNKKGGKKSKIVIDRRVNCEIDKSQLPPDAKLHHYEEVVQQDILFKRHNTLYRIPVYYSSKMKRTYRGALPEDYQGQFGGQLKSWIQLLHHYSDVTQGRLKALLKTLGIHISTGTINNILLSNAEKMKEESDAILRNGVASFDYVQIDGTKTFESGKAQWTQIICTPYYSVYQTMVSKSRAYIIGALQGRRGKDIPLRYDASSIVRLQASKVPQKDQKQLSSLLIMNKNYSLEGFEKMLTTHAPSLLAKASHKKVLAILALSYYEYQQDFPQLKSLLTDSGSEYTLITEDHGLCWIHEERHYKKMIPKLIINQKLVDNIRNEIWIFYESLLNYKKLPSDQQQLRKEVLSDDFDKIFTRQTTYEQLNKRLRQTFENKEKLLRVLKIPQMPLHNNTAELAIRRKVRKRDISLHTMSPKGTRSQDVFMSVIETAAKLGVNALDYLYDRITNRYTMTPLAELVKLYTN